MTKDTLTPTPIYVISGTGPYPVTHPYRDADDLFVEAEAAGVRTVLTISDFTITPDGSDTGGTLTLTSGAATAHDGASLIITRATLLEQGWEGLSAREVGIEAQFDQIVMAQQDADVHFGRVAFSLPPGDAGMDVGGTVSRAGMITGFNASGSPVLYSADTTGTFRPDLTFDTTADMAAVVGVGIGDILYRRGYDNAGDGGAAPYKVVAAGTGTADGGSYIDLPGSGLQVELLHGGHVRAEQFGVVLDAGGKAQERSAQFNAAFAFAADTNANTYTGDDALPAIKIETEGVEFSCRTDFTASEQITLTKTDGSKAENMNINWSGRVIAIAGGGFAAHTGQRPLPLVFARVKNCKISWPRFECEMVCAGIKMKEDIGCDHTHLDLRGFSRYGLWKVSGNDSTWHDPIIKQFYRDPLWLRNGVDPTDWTNWNGDCIVVSTKDHQFRGGQIGWGGPCVRILDAMPAANAERIPGQNCYWCGLESGQGYVDGDNGGGDAAFDNMHMMQGVNDNFLPGSGPRYGAYADCDLATGNLVIRTVDSCIGILSYCKVSNLSFFDRLDNDNCVHLLFGSQIEITNETPGSSPGALSKSTDPIHRLEPRIRMFASRGAAGSQRYPYMASAHHQRQVSVSFEDNPAEIYWNGSALVEALTSWNGDWSEWNRLNRSSGTYSGQIQYRGLLAAGTFSPSVNAAGDYWIAQGAVTINPGAVAAVDGQLIYALIAAPVVAGDWLVVDADAAPVEDTTRYETEVRASQFISYPDKNVSGSAQRTLVSGDAAFSEKWLTASGQAITRDFTGGIYGFTGAASYNFDTGITFGGGAAVLNDYQTGTWTPVVSDAATGGNNAAITIDGANFVKIGRLVHVTFFISNIDTTGMTVANDIFITGLPFQNSGGALAKNRASGSVSLSEVTLTGHPVIYSVNGTDHCKIVNLISGGPFVPMIVSDISSGVSDITGTLSYETLD